MTKSSEHQWKIVDGAWSYLPPGSSDPQPDIPVPEESQPKADPKSDPKAAGS